MLYLGLYLQLTLQSLSHETSRTDKSGDFQFGQSLFNCHSQHRVQRIRDPYTASDPCINGELFPVLHYQCAAFTATDVGHVSECECFHGLRSTIKPRSVRSYRCIDFGAVAIGRCNFSLVPNMISKTSPVALGTT